MFCLGVYLVSCELYEKMMEIIDDYHLLQVGKKENNTVYKNLESREK